MGTHADARIALVRAESALREPDRERRTDGWVYFIGAPFVQRIKIGWALNPKARYDQIRLMSPVPIFLLTGRRGTPTDERALHTRLRDYRVYGEWFSFEGSVIEVFEEVRTAHGNWLPWEPPKPHVDLHDALIQGAAMMEEIMRETA
jgi:hypothetical protein